MPWQATPDAGTVKGDGEVTHNGYEYEHPGEIERDDRHEAKALDLARSGIIDEAYSEAGKIFHLERSNDVIDEVSRHE